MPISPRGDGRDGERGATAGRAAGVAVAHDCPDCGGTWLRTEALQRIVDAASDARAVLGAVIGGRLAVSTTHAAALVGATPLGAREERLEEVRYRPCPDCLRFMNRINYARASGVVVDRCREHGVWFDANELPRVLAFVRRGGLRVARAREADQLAEERRQVALQRQLTLMDHPAPPDDQVVTGASLVGRLFFSLWMRS